MYVQRLSSSALSSSPRSAVEEREKVLQEKAERHERQRQHVECLRAEFAQVRRCLAFLSCFFCIRVLFLSGLSLSVSAFIYTSLCAVSVPLYLFNASVGAVSGGEFDFPSRGVTDGVCVIHRAVYRAVCLSLRT